jgi:pyruvyl transferase EpsO
MLLQSLPVKLRPKGLLFEEATATVKNSKNIYLIFPGGGSFGNRYHSSRRRVELIETIRPKGIIQMPVSTSFSDDGAVALDRVRGAYAAPEQKLVFVRDKRSLAEASVKLSAQADLMPDLSSILPDMRHLHVGGKGTVYLVRSDQESNNEVLPPEVKARAVDWNDDALSFPSRQIRIARFALKATRAKRLPRFVRQSDVMAKFRLKLARKISLFETARALCFLSQYDKVVTDRLHGVLLAQKLGIHVFVADNDHGKISRYLQTWMPSDLDDSGLTIFPNMKDACAAAK